MERLSLNEIKVGNVYEHVLNNDYVLALELGKEQVKIRTKSFAELYVFPWELRPIDNMGNGGGYDNYGGGWNSGPRRNNNRNNGPRRW